MLLLPPHIKTPPTRGEAQPPFITVKVMFSAALIDQSERSWVFCGVRCQIDWGYLFIIFIIIYACSKRSRSRVCCKNTKAIIKYIKRRAHQTQENWYQDKTKEMFRTIKYKCKIHFYREWWGFLRFDKEKRKSIFLIAQNINYKEAIKEPIVVRRQHKNAT